MIFEDLVRTNPTIGHSLYRSLICIILNDPYRKQPFLLFICINYFFSSVFMLTKVPSWKSNLNYSCRNYARHCFDYIGLYLNIFDFVWPEIEIFFYFSLKGESVYQYEGDRTRDDIVNFALRLVGPSVNQIESKEDFEDAKSKVIYKGVFLQFFNIYNLFPYKNCVINDLSIASTKTKY